MYFFLLFFTFSAFAGRPLLTDDWGVAGRNMDQLETWMFVDKRSVQNWIAPTFGIGSHAEFTATSVQGVRLQEVKEYSATAPILQAKYMLNEPIETLQPAFSFSGGLVPPYGAGPFTSEEWQYFFYVVGSAYLMDYQKLLLHLNLGRQQQKIEGTAATLLWGIALEYQTIPNQYVFVEATNGEIYALIPGVAMQGGIRHELKPGFQLDGSIGSGVSGKPALPLWVTLGFRIVGDYL